MALHPEIPGRAARVARADREVDTAAAYVRAQSAGLREIHRIIAADHLILARYWANRAAQADTLADVIDAVDRAVGYAHRAADAASPPRVDAAGVCR